MSTNTAKKDVTKLEESNDGQFKRKQSAFRQEVEKGGQFEPEKGRYHLYVSYACPWAHRALIVRALKGLEDIVGVSIVSLHMGQDGWPFASADKFPGATEDPNEGAKHVKDLYFTAEPNYSGRFTVPVLWDKKNKTIVNNESSEIIRNLNSAFDEFLPQDKAALDFYPEELREEIDGINEWVYDTINNGVYKCGFATTQEAYESNVVPLFKSLDRVEAILASGNKTYLVGDRLTEADIRLYTTIIRFDPVYVGHFKCNLGTIRHDYPHINRWLKQLYWKNEAFRRTTNFEHIKEHYYWSHTSINPHRIVPNGPEPPIEPL